MAMTRSSITLAALATSVLLYVSSLFLPAILFNGVPALRGWDVLLQGWLGLLGHSAAWLANIAYVGALYCACVRSRQGTIIMSGAALILGLLSPAAKEWYFNENGGTIIAGLGIGYTVWMLSFAVLAAGALFGVQAGRKP